MSEIALGWLSSAKLVLTVAFATLYWRGGRNHTEIRRFYGGTSLAIGLNGLAWWQHAWTPWHLLLLPAYIGALHLGYGGTTTLQKLARRTVYGLGLTVCALLLAWLSDRWILGAFQAVLALAASVVFGVTNPFRNAEDEEAAIAGCSVLLAPFMV